MTTTIRKWGNSLALRIPKELADELGVAVGTEVRLTGNRRRIVVAPAVPTFRLDQLLKGVTAKNRHREIDFGSACGAEVW